MTRCPKPRSWWQLVRHVWRDSGEQRLSLVAAGVAFYAMLALVPSLIALVTLYGMLFDPRALHAQLTSVVGALPSDAEAVLLEQLEELAKKEPEGLTFALLVSLTLAFWSASSGTRGLMVAVRLAYGESPRRSVVVLWLLSLGLTVVLLVGFLIAFTLVGVAPAVLERIGLGPVAAPLLWLGRWPLLAALMMAALALIYRYSPSGGRHRWRCLSWGAVFATLLWLGASLLFSAYVANFADYADTYGALAGVIVMLLWLWLGAYAVLLGAEINAALDLPEVAE